MAGQRSVAFTNRFHWILVIPSSYEDALKKYDNSNDWLHQVILSGVVFDTDHVGIRFVEGSQWLKQSKTTWQNYKINTMPSIF